MVVVVVVVVVVMAVKGEEQTQVTGDNLVH